MKTSFVSSLAIQNAMRLTIQRGQSEVQELQKEVVTGRFADVGLALGARASRSISLHRDVMRLEAMQDSNSIVTQRLSASQASLTLMSDNAQAMMEAFITASDADDKLRLDVARRDISNALDAFTAAANTSFNGEYIFSGVKTDTRPLDDYSSATSTAKAAFDAAFQGYFGFAQDDPAAAGITTAQMDDFLTNTLEPMFMGPAWKTDWSAAADTNVTSRISRNELVESTTNANTDGMRKFALAAVMGLELLGSPVSSEVRSLINSRAIEHAGEAITGIDEARSRLGVSENRVSNANTAIEAQVQIVKLHIGDLEGVDAYEASTRMNSLLAQVEASYQLTARIQQMSLMNYL